MRLPDQVLNTVCFIAKSNAKATYRATGFVVSVAGAHGNAHLYLVTAKHVANSVASEPFIIGFSTTQGTKGRFEVNYDPAFPHRWWDAVCRNDLSRTNDRESKPWAIHVAITAAIDKANLLLEKIDQRWPAESGHPHPHAKNLPVKRPASWTEQGAPGASLRPHLNGLTMTTVTA